MSLKVPALILTLALVGALPVLAEGGDASTTLSPAIPETPAPLRLGDTPVALDDLRAQARAGGFPVTLGGVHAALVLTPNPLVAPGAPILEDGRPMAAPDVDIYRGSVSGDPDSHARITLTADRADGYLYAFGTMYDIQTVDGTAVLLDADRITDRPSIIDYEESELADAPIGTDAKQGITGCLGATPEITTSPLGLVSGWTPDLVYDIVVVSDKGFTERYTDWAAAQIAHMNRIDGYYENNFGIQIQIVAQSADAAGNIYVGSSSDQLLAQLRSTWASDPTDRETVQLLSNKDFSGNTVGQAYCIGGVHSRLTHYTVTQTLGFSEFGASEITAHELGHMMSAHHHYANCHDPVPAVSTQPCTVMIPDAGLIHNGLVFSMLSRSTIREYGEQVL